AGRVPRRGGRHHGQRLLRHRVPEDHRGPPRALRHLGRAVRGDVGGPGRHRAVYRWGDGRRRRAVRAGDVKGRPDMRDRTFIASVAGGVLRPPLPAAAPLLHPPPPPPPPPPHPPAVAWAAAGSFPPDVTLLTARGRQTFGVKATYADGLTRDVTAEAKATLANPALAKLEKNVLLPVADGATQLSVEFGGKSV